MSMATEPLQGSHYKPTSQQILEARTFSARNQQLENRKKSIYTTTETRQVEQHVARNLLKSKQLLRQTPVAAAEAEAEGVKTEARKGKSQSEDIEKVFDKELDDNYEDIKAKDYQIYQNAKVNDFFKHELIEKEAKKISDICLVNDHYILVKMPPKEMEERIANISAEAAERRRREFRALKEHNDQILKEAERKHKRLYRYFQSKRNRVTQITPIHEEPDELTSDSENKTMKAQSKLYCLKMQSCWQVNEQEVEAFQTQTKIRKSISNLSLETSSQIKQNTTSTPQNPQNLNNHTNQDIPTISGSILKSSLQKHVNLHNYGSLVEESTEQNTNKGINSPPRRKCPRLETFYWLLRPFRGKSRKTKPKIQAVVYKTYFVKWTKPPDTLSHGFGVKLSRSPENEVSVLRRCRSAIF